MANKIQVKRSAVPAKVPTTSDLDLGEIAINTYDGKLYIKKDDGTPAVVQIGSGGLTNWTEGVSTSAPNATVPAVYFEATNAAAIVDAAILTKGAGSLLAAIPDNTATGGDKRGHYAVDWQRQRGAATEVASGVAAVIGGGMANTASGDYSVVAGGGGDDGDLIYGNVASGDYSFVGGGYSNTASLPMSAIVGGNSNTASGYWSFIGGGGSNNVTASYATIAGGLSNTASGQRSFVGGGENNTASGLISSVVGGVGNTASGQYAVVAGGNSNTASGTESFIGGGDSNLASGNFTTISGGVGASTRGIYGAEAHASTVFAATIGTAQRGLYMYSGETTDATAKRLTADNGTVDPANQVTLPDDATYYFKVSLVARRTDANNESAAFTFEGCIDRNTGVASTALVGTPVKTILAKDTAAWDVSVSADTTNGALAITVTGQAGKTIRWVAKIETVEVVG